MTAPANRGRLESLERDALIHEARALGVRKPEVMTRVELVDEVLRLSTPAPEERRKVRGWLGIARDLIASAVERGLHLPDAAAMIRGDVRFEPLRPPEAPVATVTLAEIYGAQGHFDRALEMLAQVLQKEPEHEAARRLLSRIEADRDARRVRARVPPPPPEPEPEVEAELQAETESEPQPMSPVGPESVEAPTLPQVALRPSPAAAPAEISGPPSDAWAVIVRGGGTDAVIHYAAKEPGEGETLFLRIVELRPRAGFAERVERRIQVAASQGTAPITGLEPRSVLRAALLVRRPTAFAVLAVAAEVARGDSGDDSVIFAPRRGVDYLAFLPG